jgi:hypothetical protein
VGDSWFMSKKKEDVAVTVRLDEKSQRHLDFLHVNSKTTVSSADIFRVALAEKFERESLLKESKLQEATT